MSFIFKGEFYCSEAGNRQVARVWEGGKACYRLEVFDKQHYSSSKPQLNIPEYAVEIQDGRVHSIHDFTAISNFADDRDPWRLQKSFWGQFYRRHWEDFRRFRRYIPSNVNDRIHCLYAEVE